jgi:hypothetical protein
MAFDQTLILSPIKTLNRLFSLIIILTIFSCQLANALDRGFVKYNNLYKLPTIRKFIAFGGYYKSGSVSKDLQISAEYGYKSNKYSHNISLEREIKKKMPGSSSENKNLYDLELSSKITIPASANYLLLYNRTKHDNKSNYITDINSVIGLGRKFFEDRWEIDIGPGYNHIEAFGYQTTINLGSELIFNLTNKIQLGQRTFFFVNIHGKHAPNSRTNIQNFGFNAKTRLSYQLQEKIHLELIQEIERKKYDSLEHNQFLQSKKYNQSYNIHLKFDL